MKIRTALALMCVVMVSMVSATNLSAQLTCVSPGNLRVVVTASNFAATGVTVVLQNGIFVGTAATIPAGTSTTFTATFPSTITTIGPAIVSATQNNMAVTVLSNTASCNVVVPNPQITFSRTCNTAGTTAPGTVCVIVTATNTGNVDFTQITFSLSNVLNAATSVPVALAVGASTSISGCFNVPTTLQSYTFTATLVGTFGPPSSPTTKTFSQTFSCPNPFFVPSFMPITFSENCFITNIASNGDKSITFTATFRNPNPTSFTQVVIIKRLDPVNNPTAVQNFQVAVIPPGGSTTISGSYISPASTNAFEVHYLDSSGNPHTSFFNGPTCQNLVVG